MKKLLILSIFVVVTLYGAFVMLRPTDPAKGEPRVIEIGMPMTVKAFLERNELETGPRIPNGYVVDVDKIRDTSPMIFDDNWISLRFLEGDQSFDLPPGRTLMITQNAGRINGLSVNLFAQPKPLNELRPYILELIKSLEAKGWKSDSQVNVPSTSEDFEGKAKNLFLIMESPNGSKLSMVLRDYGLGHRRESFILVPDPTHKPAASSETYLLQVNVLNISDTQGYEDLIYPRRIYERGNPNSPLTLRYWVDAPDWTPEKAGMIPVPEEERKTPESSKWKMPEK